MILYIDSNNNLLVRDPLFKNPIQKLIYKRRDGGIVRLGFTGEPQADPSRMIKIGVKLLNDFDAPDFLVFANSYFTLPNSPFYYIAPDFNTVSLNALFTPNLTSVLVSLEVSWSSNSGLTWDSSQIVEVEVFNDLIQGGEFFPTPLSSFESQIIPILASFVHPINIFDNDLTVNNGSIVVSGSASNISTPYLFANTLSANTIYSPNIVGTLSSNSGYVNTLSANTIYVNNLIALSSNLSLEISGFDVSGDVKIGGRLTANSLSSISVLTQTVSTTNLMVQSVSATIIYVPNIFSTNSSTTSLTVSNIAAVNISTNSLLVNSDRIRITNTFTPANSAAPGNVGELTYDSNFLYVKTFSAWKRAALTLF